ncbi:MAG: complex I subunit 5 family protein [Aggregatilineales bacterium]
MGDMLFALVALPLVVTPFIYLIGRTVPRWLAAPRAAALVTLAVMWAIFAALMFAAPIETALGNVVLRLDPLGQLFVTFALAAGTAAVIYSGPYVAREVGLNKYYALLVALIGALIGVACSGDLFNLWVWFEAVVVSSYLLVMFYLDDGLALEAGVKYLVQSAAGTGCALLGIALVLAQTGTLDLVRIGESALDPAAALAAGALFVVAFGIKVGLVPLHTWLPDAYTRSPGPISALLAAVVGKVGLIALLRVLAGLHGEAVSWGLVLMTLGALSILVGNLLALRQREVKRLLAYSSVSQIGFILLGLGIGMYAGQAAGLQAGLLHLLNHGIMKGLAFLAAEALVYSLFSQQGDRVPLHIDDLAGTGRRFPLASAALTIALLSLAGMPPLAGFMSKWQILAAGLNVHSGLVGALVVFAALNSVLSLAYYLPVINAMYKPATVEFTSATVSLPLALQAPMAFLALFAIVVGVWPAVLTALTVPASAQLAALFGG